MNVSNLPDWSDARLLAMRAILKARIERRERHLANPGVQVAERARTFNAIHAFARDLAAVDAEIAHRVDVAMEQRLPGPDNPLPPDLRPSHLCGPD